MISGTVKTDVSGMTKLSSLTKKRGITLKGVKAGVKVLERGVKPAAPRASGALAVAQGNKAAKGRRGTTVSYAVQGAKTKTVKMVRRPGRKTLVKAVPAFYDHLVNLGTKPHAVRKGASLGKKGQAATNQVGKLHPGAKANPFRKRTWEAKKGEAGAATLKVMGDEVQKAIAANAVRVK